MSDDTHTASSHTRQIFFSFSLNNDWEWKQMGKTGLGPIIFNAYDRKIGSDLGTLFKNFSQLEVNKHKVSCWFHALMYSSPLACVIAVAYFYGSYK